MIQKMIFFSGSSAVGKTSVLCGLLPGLLKEGLKPIVCKIDCIHSDDEKRFKALGVPAVTGLSGDICPDHFLVSNLPELWSHADRQGCDLLIIETAGLCHRCSPATTKAVAGCVLDCTASCRAPGQLGPMLTQADFVVLTKIDMVSQAELEIISWQIRQLNPGAALFPVDGLAGYGTDLLARWLLDRPACGSLEGDILRHTMPSGVCSYCVGEQRVGSAFQQGVVGKINFGEAERCSL